MNKPLYEPLRLKKQPLCPGIAILLHSPDKPCSTSQNLLEPRLASDTFRTFLDDRVSQLYEKGVALLEGPVIRGFSVNEPLILLQAPPRFFA